MLKEPGGQQGLLQGIKTPLKSVIMEMDQKAVGFGSVLRQNPSGYLLPTQAGRSQDPFKAADHLPLPVLITAQPGGIEQSHLPEGVLQKGEIAGGSKDKGVILQVQRIQGDFLERSGDNHGRWCLKDKRDCPH